METDPIRLKPSIVARVLGAAALFLVLLSTAAYLIKFVTGHDEVFGLLSLVFLDRERNFPTMFSVLILAMVSLIAAFIAALARKHQAPDVSRWIVLSAGFLYLAFDEDLSLHERLSVPVKKLLGTHTGLHHTFWAVPVLIVVILLGFYFLPFLKRLPARTRWTLLVAGALYVGGAIGFEFLSGNLWSGKEDLTYAMIATVEESCEMAGVILCIYALLRYLADTYGEVRFLLGERTEDARSRAVGG
jgi:hypothetical protein